MSESTRLDAPYTAGQFIDVLNRLVGEPPRWTPEHGTKTDEWIRWSVKRQFVDSIKAHLEQNA